MKTLMRRTLTLAAMPLLAATSAVPAWSQTAPSTAARAVVTLPDARGDVWFQEEDGSWSEHGPRRNVDLEATRVRHAPRKVVATAWFTDLARTTDRTVTVFWIHTSADRSFRLQQATGPGIRSGQVVLVEVVDGRLVDRSCAGLTQTVSYADDLMRVTLPRPCLGRPAWVQYHGSATATEEGPGATYTDAMRSADPVNDLYSRRIPRG